MPHLDVVVYHRKGIFDVDTLMERTTALTISLFQELNLLCLDTTTPLVWTIEVGTEVAVLFTKDLSVSVGTSGYPMSLELQEQLLFIIYTHLVGDRFEISYQAEFKRGINLLRKPSYPLGRVV